MTLRSDVDRDIDRLLEEGASYDQIIEDLIESSMLSEHDSLKLKVAFDGRYQERKSRDTDDIEPNVAVFLLSIIRKATVSVGKIDQSDESIYFEGSADSPVAYWFRFGEIAEITKSMFPGSNRQSLARLFQKCGIASKNLSMEWSAKRLRMHRVHKTAIQALEEIAKGAS